MKLENSAIYLCRSEAGGSKSYNAYVADKKEQIIEIALNGSDIRDTARVLKRTNNPERQYFAYKNASSRKHKSQN